MQKDLQIYKHNNSEQMEGIAIIKKDPESNTENSRIYMG